MGKWFVDYHDLSTCAVGVQNRHATWGLPARRGENAALPGRDGTVWAPNKPYDENDFTLEMFAAGADEDGRIPADETRATMVRRNLDRIARIFGTGQLHKLAYVEDETSPYGRRNLLTNPSFEAELGQVVTRENILRNPSGEFSSGSVAVRRNLIANPSMELATVDFPYRTNMVLNPRMEAEGRSTAYRVNRVPNPSFEVDLSMWQANGSSVIKRVAKAVAGIWPLSGRWSMRFTTGASGDQASVGGPCRVTATKTYALSGYVLNGHTAARSYRLLVQWRNKSGGFISSNTGATVTVGAGSVGRPFVIAAAPAGATQAFVKPIVTASGAGEESFWDSFMLEEAATVGTYFDGESDEVDGYRHRWRGTTGVSVSEEFGVEPLGWRSDRRLLLSSTNPIIGTQSAKVVAPVATPAGTLMFGQIVRDGCTVGTRKFASGSIAVMPRVGATALQVVTRLACYDSGGAYLGPPTLGGAPIPDITTDLEDGAWNVIAYAGGDVPARASRVCLEVRSGVGWVVDDYAYFGAAIVEPLTGVGDYFDGSTPDPDDDFDYRWAGDDNWSESQMVGSGIDYWTGTGGRYYQTGPGHIGDLCLRVESDGSSTRIRASTEPLNVQPGVHTYSKYVRPNRTQNVTAQVVVDGVVTSGTPTSATADAWTRVSVTAVIPEGARLVSVNAFGATPTATDVIDFDSALMEATSQLRPFFDGDSGDGYAWEGDTADSTSAYFRPSADGWNPWGDTRPSVYQDSVRASDRTFSVVAIANETGNFGVTSGRDAVEHDQTYTFAADVSLDVARIVRFALRWAATDGTPISEDFADFAVPAGVAFTRGVVTADPPEGAAVVSPYAAALGAAAGEVMYVDRGVFGFGGSSSYADGSTAGWEWTGDPDNSESRQVAPAVAGWYAGDNVTLSRSGLWKSHGEFSGLVEITDVDGPHLVRAYPNEAGADRYYEYDPDRSTTFAVDVHGREAGRVRLRLVPYTWTGWQYEASTDAIAAGSTVIVAAGATVRPSMAVRFSEATTHYVAEVEFFDSAGGTADLGNVFYLDRGIAGPGSWDGSYFDGSDPGAEWDGKADASSSRYVGDARVADVEVRAAIDITSRGYGASAKFSVVLHAPSVFFRDQLDRHSVVAIGRSGVVYSLYELGGGTAQIVDSVIRIWGPIGPTKIVDVGSGAWVAIDRSLKDQHYLEIDNRGWTVVHGQSDSDTTESVISSVTHNGHAVLLPLTPVSGGRPQVQVVGDPGDGAVLEIIGRRGYHIA